MCIRDSDICDGDDKTLYNTIFKKKLDLGDIIGISGFVFKTQMGEISVHVKSLKVLSKSVRPLTLIFLFVSTVVLIFIDSGFIYFAVDDEWKELLKMLLITITAAYFGGRSYEKGKSIK